MEDRYLNTELAIERLKQDYLKHKSLFVAFDFDNTVFDFFGVGDTFPALEGLLKLAKLRNCKLILFTGNEGERLKEIVQYCKDHGYEPDYVNENPFTPTRKPFYNILLDDRAGLNEAYRILQATLIYELKTI